MKRTMTLMAALVSSAAVLGACSGDDTEGSPDAGPPATDASALDSTTPDASTTDGAGDAATTDGNTAADGDADAAVGPTRLLLTNSDYSVTHTSEVVAFNVATKHVDGDLVYPGNFGTTSTGSPDPYLLEQAVDVVARLDRSQPWIVDSSWNIADSVDGGLSYSDSMAVVAAAGTKAFVIRYNRNTIDILDPSQSTDGGAPTGAVDLSSFVQAAGDGFVEMTAGIYLPSTGLLYVLLGNINQNDVVNDGYNLLCEATHAEIVGIDTTTNLPVALPGGDATGAIPLNGYNPFGAGSLTYDAVGNRFIVLENGCNAADADGGAGALQQALVESVSVTTGAVSTLLDASNLGYLGNFAYVDATHAFVQYGGSTYSWNPTQTTLGAALTNAPGSWVYDGHGNLLGINSVPVDGGTEYDVVSVATSTGTSTTLGVNPFSLTNGYPGGVDIWPHP